MTMLKDSFTTRPQGFAAAVKWAAKFVTAKPVVPVHGGLLLDVANGVLTIAGYNENATARATLDVDGNAAGRVVVSGRLLAQLVATFPDKPITVSGDGDEDELVISAGRFRATLPTIDAADFPALPDAAPAVATVSGTDFADAVGRTAVAASRDLQSRIALSGMHFALTEDAAVLMATDSYRLVRASVPIRLAGPDAVGASALVLAQTFDDVAESFIGPDDITIGIEPGASVSLTSPTRSIVLRQLGEPFEADRLAGFFDPPLPEVAEVAVAALAQPLRRAGLMQGKDGPITVTFSPDLITLTAKADQMKQEGDEEIDARYDGKEITFRFNPRYFGEAIGSVPGDTVTIAMSEGNRPVVLTAAGGRSWQHMLMPIRSNS